MEKKQFNFRNIKGMLSRDEMKQIKGGSGWTTGCKGQGVACGTGKTCDAPNGDGTCKCNGKDDGSCYKA